VLAKAGYPHVESAADGVAAEQALGLAAFDVVLSDIDIARNLAQPRSG
jgi:hypothetical protein